MYKNELWLEAIIIIVSVKFSLSRQHLCLRLCLRENIGLLMREKKENFLSTNGITFGQIYQVLLGKKENTKLEI